MTRAVGNNRADSGIFGFYNALGASVSIVAFTAMLRGFGPSHDRIVSQRISRCGRYGLGRVSSKATTTSPQPAYHAGGRFVAVMDGCLDDMDRHCGQMRGLGLRLHLDEHLSVILFHYARRSLAGVAELNGSFAAAIVDTKAGQLVLVRDCDSARHLYYATTPIGLYFASAAEALRGVLQGVPPWQATRPARKSPHADVPTHRDVIKLLPPGHALVYKAENPRVELPNVDISRMCTSSASFA